MEFTKMQGLGNDFILADDLGRAFPNAGGPELARRLCHRRTGIGADGLMLVQRGEKAPLRMLLYNSDGSVADMCGNGIRCFARYAFDRGIVKETEFDVETGAGVKRAYLTLEGGRVAAVRVGMGKPQFGRAQIPMEGPGAECRLETVEALGRAFLCSAVNTGVPHLVVFLKEPMEEAEILRYGPALETHPLFPKRVNVNFTEALGPEALRVRTWERGCGRTLACGTGSCAAAVCGARAGYTGRRVRVEVALGSLSIDWAEDGEIHMAGPADYSFKGEV